MAGAAGSEAVHPLLPSRSHIGIAVTVLAGAGVVLVSGSAGPGHAAVRSVAQTGGTAVESVSAATDTPRSHSTSLPTALVTASPATPQPSASLAVRPGTPLAWGVVENDWSGVQAAQAITGRRPNLIESYIHWGGGWGSFADNEPQIAADLQRGAMPVLTWLSSDPTNNDQSAYSPQQIAAGAFDDYARQWALGLRSLGAKVMLRFDPEMNGDWTTYSPGIDGVTAAQYVAAWRHLHDVFASAGATNVLWVWSPNVEYNGSSPLPQLYPGDAYVDWVALDGYNWGDTNGHVWQSFSSVFDRSLADVTALTSRPLMLAEVASAEIGGDKAAWIADMFAQLRADTEIRAIIWFDLDKETDWRIDSTARSADAFAAGLAQRSPSSLK